MNNRYLIVALAAAGILGVGAYGFLKTVGNLCTTPVTISKLNEPQEEYAPDKSGAKRVKAGIEGNLSAFQYQLDAGKKTRTSYDPSETLMIVILEGDGFLHSAHFSEKQELIWFKEAPIQASSFLTIPANIAYQLEASNENPLRYLIFSTKGSQAKERFFLREEHPSLFPCQGRTAELTLPHPLNKASSLPTQSEGSTDGLNEVPPVQVPMPMR